MSKLVNLGRNFLFIEDVVGMHDVGTVVGTTSYVCRYYLPITTTSIRKCMCECKHVGRQSSLATAVAAAICQFCAAACYQGEMPQFAVQHVDTKFYVRDIY